MLVLIFVVKSLVSDKNMFEITDRSAHSCTYWSISYIFQVLHLNTLFHKSILVCFEILYKNISMNICGKVTQF